VKKRKPNRKRTVKHMKDLPTPQVQFKNGWVYVQIRIPMDRLEHRLAKKLHII
jgi:hypothetical protein